MTIVPRRPYVPSETACPDPWSLVNGKPSPSLRLPRPENQFRSLITVLKPAGSSTASSSPCHELGSIASGVSAVPFGSRRASSSEGQKNAASGAIHNRSPPVTFMSGSTLVSKNRFSSTPGNSHANTRAPCSVTRSLPPPPEAPSPAANTCGRCPSRSTRSRRSSNHVMRRSVVPASRKTRSVPLAPGSARGEPPQNPPPQSFTQSRRATLAGNGQHQPLPFQNPHRRTPTRESTRASRPTPHPASVARRLRAALSPRATRARRSSRR